MSGYVYAIKVEGQDLFKIGHSADPTQRLQQLKTGCPYRLVLYRADPTFWPKEMEKVFHSLLEGYQTNGEWYEITPEHVDQIFDGTPLPGLFTVVPEGVNAVVIVPNRYFKDDNGICMSTSCVTPSELEFEALRLINSLLVILKRAREDIRSGLPTYWNPEAWKQPQ